MFYAYQINSHLNSSAHTGLLSNFFIALRYAARWPAAQGRISFYANPALIPQRALRASGTDLG